MSKEAMKLALEALEYIHNGANNQGPHTGISWRCVSNKAEQAITALREALAEQPAQQEPVVWMYVNKSTHETKFQKQMRGFVDHSLWSEVPLYGEPLANHELQCVCGAVWLGDEMVHLPDKHPPAQRTWVGLTDEELVNVMPDDDTPMSLGEAFSKFAEFIEAKLKEKNT